jgi:hypothetical protein
LNLPHTTQTVRIFFITLIVGDFPKKSLLFVSNTTKIRRRSPTAGKPLTAPHAIFVTASVTAPDALLSAGPVGYFFFFDAFSTSRWMSRMISFSILVFLPTHSFLKP